MTTRPYLVGLALLLSAMALPVAAQQLTIACVTPSSVACTAVVEDADSLQSQELVVQVKRGAIGAPGATVVFKTTGGAVNPETVTTDADGKARTVWMRSRGADAVGVSVSASLGGEGAVLEIGLTPGPDPVAIGIRLSSGDFQSWFEDGQLPAPVVIELFAGTARITDRATCTANRVAFRLRGASASVNPDTVRAALVDRGGGNVACTASTFWSLGKGIGERELDVSLVPGKGFTAAPRDHPLRVYAWARATPRFVAGLGYSRLKPYVGLRPPAVRTLKVERVDANGEKVTFDRPDTTARAAADSVGEDVEYGAIAAVSIPIPLGWAKRWDNVSLTAGVDLAKPRERFFVGGSVLRLLGRFVPVIEVVPLDVHALALFARRTELVDGECTPQSCKTDTNTTYQGVSWMLSADATSLITDLIGKLISK